MPGYQMPAGIRKAATAAAIKKKPIKKSRSFGAAIGAPSTMGPVNTSAAKK